LGWKVEIHTFSNIYGKSFNSSKKKKNDVFEVMNEIYYECAKIRETLFSCVIWIPDNTKIPWCSLGSTCVGLRTLQEFHVKQGDIS
jgi:hypothetical protein